MSQQADPKQLNFLQKKAMEWAQKVVLLHKTEFPAKLQPEKARLMERAKLIKSALEVFFKNAPWLAELNKLAPQSAAQLGVVFVPLAIIGVAGAVAVITKWSLDFASLMTFRADRDGFIKAGMTPQQATELALKNKQAEASKKLFGFDLKKIALPLLLIAGGAYFLTRKKAA